MVFRARRAGVVLVLSLVYFLYLERTGYSTGVQWLAGPLLLLRIITQSGASSSICVAGEPDRKLPGTLVTPSGAVLIAALVILGIGLTTGG